MTDARLEQALHHATNDSSSLKALAREEARHAENYLRMLMAAVERTDDGRLVLLKTDIDNALPGRLNLRVDGDTIVLTVSAA